MNLNVYCKLWRLTYRKQEITLTHFALWDELWTITEKFELKENFKEIHPQKLLLKNANTSNLKLSLLDIYNNMKHSESGTEQYGKRDEFPFSIVRMTFWDKPNRVFYAAVGAKILCLAT